MLVTVDWDAIAADLTPGSLLRIRPDAATRLWSDPDPGPVPFAPATGFWSNYLDSYGLY